MKLIIAIGNPGSEYAMTRHNAGFMIADFLAHRHDLSWTKQKKWQADIASWGMAPGGEKVTLIKPQTYVNCSGRSTQAAAAFYQVKPEDILVLVDDIHLDLGALRTRGNGSSGGHNGLKDIESRLGKAYHRLRFGIGKPPHGQVDWVLGRFSAEEQEVLSTALPKAAQCVESWLSGGLDAAQAFNGPLHPPEKNKKPTTTKQPNPSATDQSSSDAD